MSALSEALIGAADRNRELLSVLSQTDYAPSSLKQNEAYISDLKTQISKNEAELVKLHAITEDERKDHLKYRDSTVKRFAYKLGGQKGKTKFTSKQEKEEREFLEAWQREREAKQSQSDLTSALSRAESDSQHLQSETTRHSRAQHDLDTLYSSIFSGPTPEVPGEDSAEQTLHSASEAFSLARDRAGADAHALSALREALHLLRRAQSDMDSALSASTYDVFGGGGFADMMERDSLSRAQMSVTQALRHVDEARRAQPLVDVRELERVRIDHGHFVSDVLFDNIFSDLAQHDRIKESHAQVMAAHEQLKWGFGEQSRRVEGAEEGMRRAGEELEGARRRLQGIRAEAFERFAGAPPPGYSA